MGAELITAHAWLGPERTVPDYDAALAKVVDLTTDELDTFLQTATGETLDPESAQEVRDLVTTRIEQLREGLDYGRDVLILDAPVVGYTVLIAGGTSWGDDPNDTFRALNDLWSVPPIMRALGFIVDPSL